jgi:hypothetical protein
MKYPSKPPRIMVIIQMGIKFNGLFQPIKNRFGISMRNDITIPLIIEDNFKLDVAIIKPDITHNAKADKFASQVNFCMNMGMTSIIPAMDPKIIARIILLIFIALITFSLFLYNHD